MSRQSKFGIALIIVFIVLSTLAYFFHDGKTLERLFPNTNHCTQKVNAEIGSLRANHICSDYLQKNGLGTMNQQHEMKEKAEQSAQNMKQLNLLNPDHLSTYVLVDQKVMPVYLQPMCGGYVIDQAKGMPLSDMMNLLEAMEKESEPIQPNGLTLKVMSNAEVMHEWCRSVDPANHPICTRIETREYYRQPGFSTALRCSNHEQKNTEYFSCKVYEINGEVFHDIFFDPILGYYIGRQGAMQYLLDTQGKKLSIGFHAIILLQNGTISGCLANTCVAFKHP